MKSQMKSPETPHDSSRGPCHWRFARMAGSVLAALLMTAALCKGTIHVDVNVGNDENNGLDWGAGNAVATISNGVALAVDGGYGTVLVKTGTYYVVSNIVVTSAITLRSYNDGALDSTNTIVDGQGQARCLYLNHKDAMVAGFTLRNGNGVGPGSESYYYGGGVYIDEAGGVLSNCFVLSNRIAQYNDTNPHSGGGIYVISDKDASYIEDCRIKYNVIETGGHARSSGGGIAFSSGGGTLRNSLIAFNTNLASGAQQGGAGVYIYRGAGAGVIGCVISNNHAYGPGGGLMERETSHDEATAGIIGVSNLIVNNRSEGMGGGVYYYNVMQGAGMAHTTVAENTANAGGGIYVLLGTGGNNGLMITNCTISDNIATSGGGIYFAQGLSTHTNSDIVVSDSVIAGNAANTAGGIYWEPAGLIENSVIAENRATNNYGGLYAYRRFSSRVEGKYRKLVVRNSLIVSNHAQNVAGAEFLSCNADKPARMENCTVANNSATTCCGGVLIRNSSDVSLTNTIVYYNNAPDDQDIGVDNATYSLGYSCTSVTNHLDLAGALVNVTTNPPAFADLAAGDFRLTSRSPCVNAGIKQDWMLEPGARPGRVAEDRPIQRPRRHGLLRASAARHAVPGVVRCNTEREQDKP